MKEVFEQAVKDLGAMYNIKVEYALIPTASINFSPDLLSACEANTCGKYNKSWTCPPASGSIEAHKKKISAFSSAFVFTTISALDDSFDYEGMMRAKDLHNRITGAMHEKFGRINPVYGAGGCSLCETCAYPEPCRLPEKIFPSIEAAGINVTELSKAGGLRYNNGENTITYFSMILCNE